MKHSLSWIWISLSMTLSIYSDNHGWQNTIYIIALRDVDKM